MFGGRNYSYLPSSLHKSNPLGNPGQDVGRPSEQKSHECLDCQSMRLWRPCGAMIPSLLAWISSVSIWYLAAQPTTVLTYLFGSPNPLSFQRSVHYHLLNELSMHCGTQILRWSAWFLSTRNVFENTEYRSKISVHITAALCLCLCISGHAVDDATKTLSSNDSMLV